MAYDVVHNETKIYTICPDKKIVLVSAFLHKTLNEWEIAVNPIHYRAAGSRMLWRVEFSKEEALETIIEMTEKLFED